MPDLLTIGQIARESGLTAKTIRFYEAKGLTPPPRRTAGGYRVYTPTDLRRFQLIGRLRSLGLTLLEIKVVADSAFRSDCESFNSEIVALLREKRAVIDQHIAALELLRDELTALSDQLERVRSGSALPRPVSACPNCPLIDARTIDHHRLALDPLTHPWDSPAHGKPARTWPGPVDPPANG
jgi:DNA-binding transcriptional MerR regulator